MIRSITITEFLKMKGEVVLADVRTPAEFAHGHIPDAVNLPIFSNEERVQVGTTYKQAGKQAAVLLGFDLTGSKWSGFIRDALEMSPAKKIALHCWRGGMRSGAMAWALDLYGFEVYLIKGGYKHYRNWVLGQFNEPFSLEVLGGLTGTGKTKILHQLRSFGEQVIDLEDLAQHRGSSYGTMNKFIQPTQEQFENNLAEKLSVLNRAERTWVEDESSSIGKCIIPRPFWQQMLAAHLINMKVPLEQRVELLTNEYGTLDKDFLIECTERIKKRLGLERTKHCVAAIQEERMKDFIRLVLVYYDKTYMKELVKKDATRILPVELACTDSAKNAKLILEKL